MIQVKLSYVWKGVEVVDMVESRMFTANAIADSLELKAVASTGTHIDVNPIRAHYPDDTTMIFIFDADNETIAGYAIWVSGEEEGSNDVDEDDEV